MFTLKLHKRQFHSSFSKSSSCLSTGGGAIVVCSRFLKSVKILVSIYKYILSSSSSEISITYLSNNKVRAAFTLFDHDGDGKVTIEELRLLYTSLGQNFSEVGNSGGDCGDGGDGGDGGDSGDALVLAMVILLAAVVVMVNQR